MSFEFQVLRHYPRGDVQQDVSPVVGSSEESSGWVMVSPVISTQLVVSHENTLLQFSGSQPRAVLPSPTTHLTPRAMSRDICLSPRQGSDGATGHPTTYRTAPQQRIFQLKVSIMPKLRTSSLVICTCFFVSIEFDDDASRHFSPFPWLCHQRL